MGKADEFRKKFSDLEKKQSNLAEVQRIYDEMERIGEACKSMYYYAPISYMAKKELTKEGFSVDYENGHYIITW